MKNDFKISVLTFQASLFVIITSLTNYYFIQIPLLVIYTLLTLSLVFFVNLFVFIYLIIKYVIENDNDYLKSASILLINIPLYFLLVFLFELILYRL